MTETIATTADGPPAWTDPDPDRPLPFWDGLRRDIVAHRPEGRRDPRPLSLAEAARVVVRSSGFHVMAVHRLAPAPAHRAGLARRPSSSPSPNPTAAAIDDDPMNTMNVLMLGHSYVVALNRRLCRELAVAGGDRVAVTVAAPASFRGDLRPIRLERLDGEPYAL